MPVSELRDTHPAVGHIAKETGFSQRRFIQVFKREVRLSPKLFDRVKRFQLALSLTHREPRPDWAQLALECGYFDQPHFINEFRGFSGFRPWNTCGRKANRSSRITCR